MDKQNNNKIYKAEDIIRYHSGKMSVAEMHAMEKAAMEDPFLADAMEGYTYTPTPAEDLQEIKERLSEKKRKRGLLLGFSNQWLRIAATILVIVGIGYLTFYLDKPKENMIVAKLDTLSGKKNMEASAIDTAAVSSEIATGNSKASGENLPASTMNVKQQHINDKNSVAANTSVASSGAAAMMADDRSMSSEKSNAPKLKDLSLPEAKGRLVDEKGNPVSYATIQYDKKGLVTSDSSGRFSINRDTPLTVNINAVGFASKKAPVTNDSNPIVLQHSDVALNEVVVTGAYGMKRTQRKISQSVAKAPDNVNYSEPVIGWIKYQQYITANIELPEKENGEKYSGEVVLSFSVSKRGNPTNIKVERSLCEECDKEAIRLLEQGSKWKYTGNKQGRITIKF